MFLGIVQFVWNVSYEDSLLLPLMVPSLVHHISSSQKLHTCSVWLITFLLRMSIPTLQGAKCEVLFCFNPHLGMFGSLKLKGHLSANRVKCIWTWIIELLEKERKKERRVKNDVKRDMSKVSLKMTVRLNGQTHTGKDIEWRKRRKFSQYLLKASDEGAYPWMHRDMRSWNDTILST